MRALTTWETLDAIKDNMSKYKTVFYSRFGDGDFRIMRMKDCIDHQPNFGLAEESREAFHIDHPQFLRAAMVNYEHEPGMTNGMFAMPSDNSEIEDLILKEFLFAENTVFYSHSCLLYYAVFKPDELVSFLDEYIRPKKKVFVGSVSRKDASRLLGDIEYYVQIPHKEAYQTIDEWFPRVLEYIKDGAELCIPTAGVCTRVFQKRLWYALQPVHSIEIGSLIDAVAGIKSRTWIRMAGDRINKILL